MSSRALDKQQRREKRLAHEHQEAQQTRIRALRMRVVAAMAIGLLVLGGLFLASRGGGPSGNGGEQYAFSVGSPGPGQPAPPVVLPSTKGGIFNLAAQRGKTTLLYFQEGVTCQPCWDQIKALEKDAPAVRALGIDEVVSITTDPLSAIRQVASDDGLRTPILSDSSLSVSRSYSANQYGMMGTSRDGHSFVIVGPDGRIRFRADYGGPPNYTMFVPVPSLLRDFRKGLANAPS